MVSYNEFINTLDQQFYLTTLYSRLVQNSFCVYWLKNKKDIKGKCRIVFKFGFAKNGEEKTEEEKEGKE